MHTMSSSGLDGTAPSKGVWRQVRENPYIFWAVDGKLNSSLEGSTPSKNTIFFTPFPGSKATTAHHVHT